MRIKKVAIIGANEFQLELIVKAQSRGYETHVFSWACGDIGETQADFFYPISIVEKEDILTQCQNVGIDAICSIASDLAAITVNYVSSELGLIGNSMQCTEATTNKFVMRKVLKDGELPIPHFQLINSIDDIEINDLTFPCIVKPIDRSGSRGISLVTEFSELITAVAKSKENSFVDTVLIEEYICGREFSIESITYGKQHRILQITEKFTSGAPYFIERGHLAPARLSNIESKKIKSIVEKSLTQLEICNGASHSEVMLTASGDVKIIEIGARMGGDFIGSHLVEDHTGYDYTGAVLDIALGNTFVLPNVELLCYKKSFSLIVYFFNDVEYSVLDRLPDSSIAKVAKNSNFTGDVSNSAERFGYAFINTSKNELSNTLKEFGFYDDSI